MGMSAAAARASRQDAAGVTLIEFIVMLAVLGIVISGIYGFVVNGAASAAKTNDFLRSQAQVRAALDNIIDESRWAQGVTAASSTSVTLAIPQNTPFSASSPYSVTFAYNAAQQVVTRQQDTGPAVPLAYLVAGPGASTGLTLIYFDGGNNSLGSSPSAGQLSTIARLRAVVSTTSGRVTRYLAGDAALRAH
jgi:Tfp pilus assembly protein PilW